MTGRRFMLTFVVFLLVTPAANAQNDPLIEDMVAAVSQARVTGYVQTLQDFQTRYAYAQGNTDAGDWLFSYFAGLGLEVERHAFSFSGQNEENIIARIPGTTYPDEIVAISAHFDSYSPQAYSLAPGADDNASGIAAVLEAALVFSSYEFERTIEFMCFNAEEQGRKGSHAVAVDYLAAGKNLVAVVNNDMIGYWPTAWGRDLDVAYEPVSEWLADQVIQVCRDYVGIPISKHPSGVCRDDHYAFTLLGIPAVTNMDCWQAHNGSIGGETTPHYHRTSDTIGTLNLACMTEVIQVNVASVADLAVPVGAAVGVGDAVPAPAKVVLHPNVPNPFNPRTRIRFDMPIPAAARLTIYDVSGRLVRKLIDDPKYPAGRHEIVWDGRSESGGEVRSGVYFYKLHAGDERRTRKMVLVR